MLVVTNLPLIASIYLFQTSWWYLFWWWSLRLCPFAFVRKLLLPTYYAWCQCCQCVYDWGCCREVPKSLKQLYTICTVHCWVGFPRMWWWAWWVCRLSSVRLLFPQFGSVRGEGLLWLFEYAYLVDCPGGTWDFCPLFGCIHEFMNTMHTCTTLVHTYYK